jgi:hypothetical protein
MGWSESPPFFCAANETARDIIDNKMRNNVILPEQPMENIMKAVDWTTVNKLPEETSSHRMQSAQVPQPDRGLHRQFHRCHPKHQQSAPTQSFLPHLRRHHEDISAPDTLSGIKMAHPVLEKKLFENGIWDTRKEILGWLFVGMARTIKLPHHKCTKLLLELKRIRRLPKLEVKRLQKLHGRLQFATIAIPCGKPIPGQLNWCMSSASKHPGRKLVETDALQAILRD